MASRELQNAGEVIDALGGTAATARLMQKHLPQMQVKDQHVSNWRAAGRLPSYSFLILTEELTQIDKTAPPSVWGIKEPERAAS